MQRVLGRTIRTADGHTEFSSHTRGHNKVARLACNHAGQNQFCQRDHREIVEFHNLAIHRQGGVFGERALRYAGILNHDVDVAKMR